MNDQQTTNEAADGGSALTAELGIAPDWWHYRINRNWDGFSKELPPDDAYDKGTLIPLYTQAALIKLLAASRLSATKGCKMTDMEMAMIRALAAIDDALGLPQDGCNSTAQTLAKIEELKAAAARGESLAHTVMADETGHA